MARDKGTGSRAMTSWAIWTSLEPPALHPLWQGGRDAECREGERRMEEAVREGVEQKAEEKTTRVQNGSRKCFPKAEGERAPECGRWADPPSWFPLGERNRPLHHSGAQWSHLWGDSWLYPLKLSLCADAVSKCTFPAPLCPCRLCLATFHFNQNSHLHLHVLCLEIQAGKGLLSLRGQCGLSVFDSIFHEATYSGVRGSEGVHFLLLPFPRKRSLLSNARNSPLLQLIHPLRYV